MMTLITVLHYVVNAWKGAWKIFRNSCEILINRTAFFAVQERVIDIKMARNLNAFSGQFFAWITKLNSFAKYPPKIKSNICTLDENSTVDQNQ